MDGKRKCAVEKRRPSKSIFDDEDIESDEDIKVGKRTNTRISSESSQSTSTVSREYVSRGIQNLSESSSDSETDEPPNKRLSDINQSNSGVVDDSDDSTENDKVSEYFDFTEIISTQQKIKELEANKANEENGESSKVAVKKQPGFCISEVKRERTRKCKNVSTPKSKKQVVKNEDDQIDVSELLAMGESKAAEPKSDDDEGNTCIPSHETVKKEIEVRIDLPSIVTKKNKKKFDIDAALKRRLNAVKRENQVFTHKVHILCLIAHWNMVDNILNSETLLGSALSIVPSEKFYPPKMASLEYLEKLVNWFTKKINVSDKPPDNPTFLKESLLIQFSECKANSIKDKVLMFVCIARVLGLKCRIMVNLQPVPLKPNREDLLVVKSKKDDEEEGDKDESDSSEDEFTEVVEVATKAKGKEKKGGNSEYFDTKTPNKSTAKEKKTPVKNATAKSKTKKQENSTKNTKSTSKAGSSKAGSSKAGSSKSKETTPKKGATKDRRVISSDSDDLIIKKKKKKVGSDIWSEVFLEAEEKWISVDLCRGSIHCIEHIQSLCSQPVVYVIGWNGNHTFKDLTKRYAPQWMTTTRKHRVESDWWDETIAPWKPKRTAREKEEDYELDKILEDKPLPAAISEYKNHPLYVLKRHLLKFEAIYPPDAPPIGFVKGEPVYSRLCVTELHSKETWMRQAKSIRLNEKAYKIVKARPKYDKLTGTIVSDLPLEIFGHWQVEDYQPPVAVDGIVPRNDWGNVELYKPSMLPVGTVHLQIPGLLRVARKLKIDCAPALVGWEYNQGCSFPVMDGFVVCEEFKDILLDNWNKSIDESAKREKDKLEQRVYGNWKRLIKGLIIRERLEKKYNFGPLQDPKEKKKAPKRKHKK